MPIVFMANYWFKLNGTLPEYVDKMEWGQQQTFCCSSCLLPWAFWTTPHHTSLALLPWSSIEQQIDMLLYPMLYVDNQQLDW